MSHSRPYLPFLRISGATYPGLPHTVLANSVSSKIFPNPKSESFKDDILLSLVLKRRFSGFISL